MADDINDLDENHGDVIEEPTPVKDSILSFVKKLIGIQEEDTYFDTDIVSYINMVFLTLYQIGVNDKPYMITGYEEEWKDYTTDMTILSFVKQYVHLRVKVLFDPPTMSSVSEAYNAQIKELEWRIHSEVNYYKNEEEVETDESNG